MKQLLTSLLVLLVLTSCGSSKKSYRKAPRIGKTERIIQNAQSYNGTRYKFGGTTRKGMDCSGLIFVAFQEENIALPRVSREMAKKGQPVHGKNIAKGDLLFFKTSKTRNRINHVGLVTEIKNGQVYFIHATTSKGVLTSNLNERYWDRAFVMAKRLL
ncbi:C40 family peptidase [Dokdonia sp. Hel_I_53]|uniref:C40 family peptidase n=1 Tax=Dokdonia sp. Hel_I_53 TaxID=1566287 RepID=UPI00119C8504|nr:C40 family peptidase [Dokdonia sp. Hel_I_53]TVZ53110.1 NlpC/P60 family protein [Dokdonia sp. Hel_I_53]